jgi:glycosyltransferase involved in cell wall biosynthesis
MKILHVITRSEWGGAQKIVFLLSIKQKKKGHKVTVLCGENGRLVEELRKEGIRVILNPFLIRQLSWRDLSAFLFMLKEVRQGYDLIHAHSSKAGILARIAAKLTKVPVCFTVHGFGISPQHAYLKQILYHKVEAFWARFTDALVFVSPGNLEVARKHGWLKHSKYSLVILNGIDIPSKRQVLPNQQGLRKKFGIPEDALLIGNLARVTWIKNPDFWFEIAKEFISQYPESYFVWFGGGNLETYQGEERIRFVGELKDIDLALSSIDILFLTSHSEGMPVAVLEGMAQGVPVVLPNLPGLKEIVGAGGKIYPPGEKDSAIKILNELRDKPLRKLLGEQGYYRCQDFYSADRMANEYEKVYVRIVGNAKQRRT